MSIRLSVREDLTIEIMASNLDGKRPKHLKSLGVERALILARFFLKREFEAAQGQKFTPQLIKEARKSFDELSQRSPYGNGKKS